MRSGSPVAAGEMNRKELVAKLKVHCGRGVWLLTSALVLIQGPESQPYAGLHAGLGAYFKKKKIALEQLSDVKFLQM